MGEGIEELLKRLFPSASRDEILHAWDEVHKWHMENMRAEFERHGHTYEEQT